MTQTVASPFRNCVNELLEKITDKQWIEDKKWVVQVSFYIEQYVNDATYLSGYAAVHAETLKMSQGYDVHVLQSRASSFLNDLNSYRSVSVKALRSIDFGKELLVC